MYDVITTNSYELILTTPWKGGVAPTNRPTDWFNTCGNTIYVTRTGDNEHGYTVD